MQNFNPRQGFSHLALAVGTAGLMLSMMSCRQEQPSVNNGSPTTETIVMIRHGEKPANGLGQLDCKGLNRALALPAVLLGRYGKPDYIYAPDPADQVKDHDRVYSYVRPLATIEPTAIRAGLPVNTQISYKQIGELQRALTQPEYANSTIFVAWEHGYLNDFGKQFMRAYGNDASAVPYWQGNDYDSIYVFKLKRSGGHAQLSFRLEQEGLNTSLSDACPAQ